MKEETKTRRLGIVRFTMKYVVDLDDEEMVQEAKDCLYEDIMNSCKFEEIHHNIDVEADPTATWEDVPDFLKEEVGDIYDIDTEEE